MNIQTLQEKFFHAKQYRPSDVNELLDFSKSLYLNGTLSITDYRTAVKDLESQGASTPENA